MSHTELQLVAVYGGPAVPLAEISKPYFGMNYQEAKRAAALNRLPVATFRLRDSVKSPVMVRARDLAAFIDQTADAAFEQWERSNT